VKEVDDLRMDDKPLFDGMSDEEAMTAVRKLMDMRSKRKQRSNVFSE
jgi:hypothetical protein